MFLSLIFVFLIPTMFSFELARQENGDVHIFKLGHAGVSDKFIVNGNLLVNGYAESHDSDDKRAIQILAMSLGINYTALNNGVSACKEHEASTCLMLCSGGTNTHSCYCGTGATVCSAGQSCAISTSMCTS